MLNDILFFDQRWLPSQSDFPPIFITFIPSLTFTDFERFPCNICNGCGMPAENAYPSGHWFRPLLGAWICSDCWDQFSRLYTELMTVSYLTFIELREVSMEHLLRVWHASRERLPFRTPGAVPHCGTCLCSNCWDQNPRTCHVFSRLFTSNTHWYFLDLSCSSNPLNRICQHLTGSKIFYQVCVFGWSGNHDVRPASDWLRHFYSSETAAQFDETSQKERTQRLQPSIRILHWFKKKIAVAASDLLRRFRC